MSYIPDAYDMWARHDAEQEAELQKLPKCSECGEAIQTDECYEFDGSLICPRCLVRNHRKWVDEYCE